MRILCSLCLVLALVLGGAADARAGSLADRMASFPRWEGKPPVAAAQGDLVYPAWMVGDWEVTSTLVELVAPLAPDIVTPGFESNRQYLNEPVRFRVRFVVEGAFPGVKLAVPSLGWKRAGDRGGIAPTGSVSVVAARGFNGLNIARSYLGDRAVMAVKVDPQNPNRQITLLRDDRQLVSTVTLRGSETPEPDRFLATEIFQQEFRGGERIYFNEVETTTAYEHEPTSAVPIQASQVTAVYLSPQDPGYFKAIGRPVALYRYQLEFAPVSDAS